MATQHPDNARAPYWERGKGDGFISVHEELKECLFCFRDLEVGEFMWDWEGKFADEAVIDKLFSNYYDYFKKHQLGKDKFLTFRLPNIWKEKGYSLIRALMVILTSEDFARDLKFHYPPLFEVILPMTEKAKQLIYIKKSFKELSCFKCKAFNHYAHKNCENIEIIPLLEGVENQIKIKRLLNDYVQLHKSNFKSKPQYIRPFLARSDPALISGLLATVLANKIALSETALFSKKSGIPTYPIIGAGSLVFRGGLSPQFPQKFINEYSGVRTLTIQSAFKYDYPIVQVKNAINYFNNHLCKSKTRIILDKERRGLLAIVRKCEKIYQETLPKIISEVEPLFSAVPRRRERRLHIGFLAYGRKLGKIRLPRAINFVAAFYSLGIPPEFIGLGRLLAKLSKNEYKLFQKHYLNFIYDIKQAGRFLNTDNVSKFVKKNKAWKLIQQDIDLTEKILKLKFSPKLKDDFIYKKLTDKVLLFKNNPQKLKNLISETGKIRKSLG